MRVFKEIPNQLKQSLHELLERNNVKDHYQVDYFQFTKEYDSWIKTVSNFIKLTNKTISNKWFKYKRQKPFTFPSSLVAIYYKFLCVSPHPVVPNHFFHVVPSYSLIVLLNTRQDLVVLDRAC